MGNRDAGRDLMAHHLSRMVNDAAWRQSMAMGSVGLNAVAMMFDIASTIAPTTVSPNS